jgi:small subunit ribosomal protein S8
MDPIAQMIASIKNASKIKSKETVVPYSNFKESILSVMKKANYIQDFKKIVSSHKKFIRIILKYENGVPAIREIKKISIPSRRRYVAKNKIPRVLQGFGIVIVSTPKGVFTGFEAKKAGVGGEIVCEIW